jgi:response regulator RpfG family c-di-GMP phosphodiesterase
MGFLLLFNTDVLSDKQENAKIQLINSLVGMLSVAIEAQHLLAEQKKLLNAFIKLIAGAIDEKSPYTGGHCQRVPVITKMLAKAAVEAQDGPFASFTLSANEWDELHTACWLHDCGKITTPEVVVDKATKLEQIYNRIHEIRMRFELLKREKEIEFLRHHGRVLMRRRWTQHCASLTTISTLLPAVILAASFSLMMHWHVLIRLPTTAGRAHSTIR